MAKSKVYRRGPKTHKKRKKKRRTSFKLTNARGRVRNLSARFVNLRPGIRRGSRITSNN